MYSKFDVILVYFCLLINRSNVISRERTCWGNSGDEHYFENAASLKFKRKFHRSTCLNFGVDDSKGEKGIRTKLGAFLCVYNCTYMFVVLCFVWWNVLWQACKARSLTNHNAGIWLAKVRWDSITFWLKHGNINILTWLICFTIWFLNDSFFH